MDGDIVTVRGLPVTSPEKTFLDLAASVPLEDLVAVGDAMLAAHLGNRKLLVERVNIAGPQPGIRTARRAVPMLDERAQSMPESILRVRMIMDRLPPPEPQCLITSTNGRIIAHSDLGFPDYQTAVEHEGRHHAEGDQFSYDTRRYTEISAAGWLILRSSAVDLSSGSHRLLRSVRQTLILRGWRPS